MGEHYLGPGRGWALLSMEQLLEEARRAERRMGSGGAPRLMRLAWCGCRKGVGPVLAGGFCCLWAGCPAHGADARPDGCTGEPTCSPVCILGGNVFFFGLVDTRPHGVARRGEGWAPPRLRGLLQGVLFLICPCCGG